jgi:Endodeoxyribonuclease RusA
LRAQLQKPPCFTCTVDIKFEIGRPDQRRRDLDNFATKAVLDLLSHHHVLLDDSQVTSLAARWDDAVTPGRIRACIAAAPGYSMGFDAAVRAQWIADTVSFLQRNLRP